MPEGGTCEYCEKDVPDFEPEYCCSGFECGCMGLPVEPCFCNVNCMMAYEVREEAVARECAKIANIERQRVKMLMARVNAQRERALAAEGLPDEFIPWPLGMKSAIDELESLKYEKRPGKTGGWFLIGVCDNPGDHVYRGYENRQQDGFCGRHMTFELEEGGSITLKGPYKCGAPSSWNLAHSTRGVIAKKTHFHEELKDYGGRANVYTDILHLDRDWTLGTFGRIENMAQDFADSLGEEVFFSRESQGGAMRGRCSPKVSK